jgi:hypothetical protein
MQRNHILLTIGSCLALLTVLAGCPSKSKPSGGSAGTNSAGTGASAAGSGGGDAGTAASSDTRSICQTGCNLQAMLKCPNDPPTCVNDCLATAAQIPAACAAQGKAALSCTSKLPLSQLECDSSGMTTTKAGACTAELNALTTCAQGG